MTPLYPSWIEIPVDDLERALRFYRAVFDLVDTPLYDNPPAQMAVLLPSDKQVRNPGVSLVKSPLHKLSNGGSVVNFHVETYEALKKAVECITEFGGQVRSLIVDMGDGVHYINVFDCEGNPIALSSYEEPDA